MSELSNIFNSNNNITEEQLMLYLQGKLTGDALHEVEKQMSDSAFIDDAAEGLQSIQDKTKLENYVLQLNKNLHQQLQNKKTKKEKRNIKNLQWGIVAAAIILLLCLLGYTVLKMMQH